MQDAAGREREAARIAARIAAVCLVLALTGAAVLHAQPVSAPMQQGDEGSRVLVGVTGGMMFTTHSGTITTSDGTYPCGCTFTSGSGTGVAFAGEAVAVLTGAMRLIGRITYEQRDAVFESRQSLPVMTQNGQENAVFVDQLDARIGMMSLDVLAAWEEASTGMHVAAGPSFGFVLSQGYQQRQRIETPAGVTFIDGTREKLLFDDARSLAKSPLVSLRMLAGIIRPIGPNLFVTGDVSYALPLTSMGKAMSWKSGGAGVSAGVLVGI